MRREPIVTFPCKYSLALYCWQLQAFQQYERNGFFISIAKVISRTRHHVTLYAHCLFIHLVVCLTTGPKPLPKRALHIVRSGASSFKWEYPLLSLRSSSSFLRLLPRLLVTSIPPFIFPSITFCRRPTLFEKHTVNWSTIYHHSQA